MRALLVVNPAATTTSPRTREVLLAALEGELKLEIVETTHRVPRRPSSARQARRDGLELVIALGGDGTVNEVVNGLLDDGPHDDVPDLAVVPGGGTNVFARALGHPPRPGRGDRCPARRRCASAVDAASASARWTSAGSPSTPAWAGTPRSCPGRRPPSPRVRASLRAGTLSGQRLLPRRGPAASSSTPTAGIRRSPSLHRPAGPDDRPGHATAGSRDGARRAAHGDGGQHRALDLPRRPADRSVPPRRRSTTGSTSTALRTLRTISTLRQVAAGRLTPRHGAARPRGRAPPRPRRVPGDRGPAGRPAGRRRAARRAQRGRLPVRSGRPARGVLTLCSQTSASE